MNDRLDKVTVSVKFFGSHLLDGKVQQLLTGIQSSDECQQLQAVMELCQVFYSTDLTCKYKYVA